MRAADVFVIVATLLAWTTLIPQIRRLLRTGDIEGVSITWPFIGLVSNTAWTLYLFSQSFWAATPSTIGMVVFYVIVIKVLSDMGAPLRQAFARGSLWATALAAVGALFGWGAFGLVLGWSYAIQMAPPLVAAYRSASPTGVSIGSWALITLESLLWGIYGWLLDDLPIQVFALTGLVAGSSILARAASTRRNQEPARPIASSETRL
ncbi:MAG TPA: PQ-loop repeat-containing protein [Acidimicrobiia bacterium]